jgi:hypothetical protein
MVRFKVLYPPGNKSLVANWEWWRPELQGTIDLSAPGEIIFYGADLAHKAKEAKALFGQDPLNRAKAGS